MTVATKTCARCRVEKPIDAYHIQSSGPLGRHSWCKQCFNAYARDTRKRNGSPEQRRRWQIKTRYGLTVEAVDELRRSQDGRCGLCESALTTRYHIDHDHITGRVRGLLCHRCNIVIGGLDDPKFHAKVNAWLERGR